MLRSVSTKALRDLATRQRVDEGVMLDRVLHSVDGVRRCARPAAALLQAEADFAVSQAARRASPIESLKQAAYHSAIVVTNPDYSGETVRKPICEVGKSCSWA